MSVPCAGLQKCKSTFLRCAVLLKWEFRKELFGKLAWGHGLGAENDVFVYVVRCGPPRWDGPRWNSVLPSGCTTSPNPLSSTPAPQGAGQSRRQGGLGP